MPRPNEREHNVHLTQGKPSQAIKDDNKVSGVRLAKQSSNLEDRPTRTKNSGNTFKAKPGAK